MLIICDEQMLLTDVGSRCPGSTTTQISTNSMGGWRLQAGRVEVGGLLVRDEFKTEICVKFTFESSLDVEIFQFTGERRQKEY